MRKVIPWFSIILLTVAIALAGCGAGGSSSTNPVVAKKTVSGVAAAGAPIIGRAYLKDSSNPPTTLGPAEIAADGSFSFDVTNLTAPFYLQAEGTVGGQGYKLHSVAMSDGTANINPLTDLAVAAAAGVTDPVAVFNNPGTYPIMSTNLDKAIADIQAMLKPLLDAYSANTNFLSDSYTADHTGLDGLLDVVKVSIDAENGNVSISDKITNTQIGATTTTTIAQPTDPISELEAKQSDSVPTDLQEIAAFLSRFATTFNKGPKLQATDLDPYFATDFGIYDGLNRDQEINDWIGNASGCDNCVSSISGVSIKERKVNGDYIITAVAHMTNGAIYTDVEFTVTKEGDTWKFKGNGYKSNIDLQYNVEKYVYSDGKASVVSGIRVDVEDEGNLGLQSATITGPGLPSEGIKMAKTATDAVDMQPVSWNEGEFYHVYPMSDAVIEALPEKDLIYTIIVKDTAGAVVETRTRTLPKRPFKVSEVGSSYFLQVISGIPTHNTSSLKLGGETLSFTYAKPTAYQVANMNVGVGYSGSSGWDYTEKELSPNETSASIVTLGLPEGTIVYGGWLRADVWDLYGREVAVEWQFSPTSTTPFEGGTTPEPVAPSSIVGSWGDGVTGSNVLSLTFYPDGTYIHWEKNNDGSGVEYGTYIYDAATHTLTATSTVDENADAAGLTGYAGETTVSKGVTVDGDTITFTNSDGSTNTFSRVVDANKPIVGSWEHDHIESWVVGPGDKGSLTFYANGTYIEWEDTDTYCGGVEYGTYSYDSNAKTLTVTSTVDENGHCGGFTSAANQSNVIAGFSVSGDVMKFEHSDGKTDTFKRVKEPPAILGTWFGGDPATHNFGVIAFFADGTYVMAEDGIADSSGQAGMEHGTYTWNPATGAFTASASLADSSGDWGLSHPAGAVTITISSNTLTYTDSSEVFTATRLMPDTSNAIVGTLYGGNPGERPIYVITFFADGKYMMADDDDSTTNTDPNNPICQPGIERGIYTWDPVTGAFFANPTIVDTNGECGFSTGDGLGTTGTITISGNTWTMDLGGQGGTHQGTRLVP